MPLPLLPGILARVRLDRRRLHELTVLGRTPGPEEAVAAGLLDELVESDALEEVAEERARELAQLSDVAYSGTLAAVWGAELERITALADAQIARREAARRAGD